MLIIAGTIAIDAANRDALFAAAREMMAETHKEQGCVAYRFSADLTDPAQVHLFECWESQAALDAHFAAPHMARFQAAIAKLGMRDARIQKYTVSGVGPVF